MFFQKGILFRYFSKNKIAFLNLSIIVLIFCAVLARYTNETEREGEINVYLPIDNVETSESVYSITVSLSGDELDNNIKLLSQVMKGLKANGTFFITSEWIKDNPRLFSQLKMDGHNFGLRIENNKSDITRNEAMHFLANENDKFYEYADIYPRIVRIEKDKSGKISELINAFGQIYVSSSVNFNEVPEKIKPGDIVSIDNVNEETAYVLAEFMGRCSKNSLNPLALEDMLKLTTKNNLEIKSE